MDQPSGKVVAGALGSQFSPNSSSFFPWLPGLGRCLASPIGVDQLVAEGTAPSSMIKGSPASLSHNLTAYSQTHTFLLHATVRNLPVYMKLFICPGTRESGLLVILVSVPLSSRASVVQGLGRVWPEILTTTSNSLGFQVWHPDQGVLVELFFSEAKCRRLAGGLRD